MEKYTIDRFEGELAVLLLSGNETVQKDVPKEQLPDGVQEGDVIKIKWMDDGTVKEATFNKEETESRKEKAKSLLEKLKNKK
ncbi:DUF3006 domain-containing protein [Alteribacillus bidgolensis]|uniref:DUF3006 domain-containing protein n=1 Tax=Alteribacillus bidgolensis TaxID=930129 RepID=A0A1G8BL85_9BACI|nr:DUF3006 domain-containing protein [Alteribacillus bidgolensis]SDH33804.1 Protein of unknown function [Alteribacillus bidgolensis]